MKILLRLFLVPWFFASPLVACSQGDNIIILPATEDELIYEVHFIDVGQGDAILVLTPEKTMLVDGGGRNSGVTRYLQDLNIEHIDIVVGTHPHADHIGGLIEVFQTFSVGEVIDPGVVHTTLTFTDYLTTIDRQDINFTVGRRGLTRELGEDASFVILHPTSPRDDQLNNASIVAHVTLGEVKVLLTGDLHRDGEQEILAYNDDIQSHILKVAHHGSFSSTSTAFLTAVHPKVSIIMSGANNQYGHPHSEPLQRLHAVGTEIYRTDIQGHIVVRSDGITYTVTTEK